MATGWHSYTLKEVGDGPISPAFVLKILSVTNAASGNTVTCESVSGITYYLQNTADLTEPFAAIQSNLVESARMSGHVWFQVTRSIY